MASRAAERTFTCSHSSKQTLSATHSIHRPQTTHARPLITHIISLVRYSFWEQPSLCVFVWVCNLFGLCYIVWLGRVCYASICVARANRVVRERMSPHSATPTHCSFVAAATIDLLICRATTALSICVLYSICGVLDNVWWPHLRPHLSRALYVCDDRDVVAATHRQPVVISGVDWREQALAQRKSIIKWRAFCYCLRSAHSPSSSGIAVALYIVGSFGCVIFNAIGRRFEKCRCSANNYGLYFVMRVSARGALDWYEGWLVVSYVVGLIVFFI